MNFKHLTMANVFVFALYAIFFYLGNGIEFLQIARIISGLSVILISGLNLAILLKIILKKKFDFVEILNISFLGIIIFIPFILLIENSLLERTYPLQSFITTAAIALFASIMLFFKKNNAEYQLFEFPRLTIRKILLSPLTWAVLLEILVIIFTVFVYKFLPDKDPFTWHVRLTQYFEGNIFPEIFYRLLFYHIYFLFNNLAEINAFVFLKYVTPFLFLSVFLPIWMVIRKIDDPKKQTVALLIPFLAPNTILFSLMGMPQAFFIILQFYFIFFLFYSCISKEKIYYFLAGIIALACTLYYEAGIIIFVIWMLFTIFYERKTIISNKRDAFFIFIIIILNISIIRKYGYFMIKWIKKIISSLAHPHFNFIFPLEYKSIDGIKIGTQSIIGAARSYLGYAGPVIILFILIILYLLLRKKIDIGKYWAIFKKSGELQIIFTLFAIFFSIAEILPRFPGIALLPGRAWIFSSIFFSFFIMLSIIKNKDRQIPKIIYSIYIICIFLSICGAIHSNYLKKHQVTKNQFRSAEWIKEKLPKDRLIISTRRNQLLQYFGESDLFAVNADYFYDEKNIFDTVDELKNGSIDESKNDENFKKYTDAITSATNEYVYNYLHSGNIKEKNALIGKMTTENIKLSKELNDNFKSSLKNEKRPSNIYIFIRRLATEILLLTNIGDSAKQTGTD
jgi:hypothetical protein